MTPRLSLRTVVILIGMALCIIAVVAVLMALAARKDAQRAKAAATLSDGRTAAAQDASAVRDANDLANASTRSEVKDAQDEVRQADPADRDRIARDRLCRLNPGACAH